MCIDLLITGAMILTVGSGEPAVVGDVSVAAGRVVAVGGVQKDARESALRTVEGAGTTVVPLVVHTLARDGYRQQEIAVGNPADFAVVRGRVSRSEAVGVFTVSPADLRAVVLGGQVVVAPFLDEGETWAGSRVALSPLAPGDPRMGTWIDRTGYLHQALDVRGRYDETRAGRRHAWTGQYWVREERIVYLDDTGFWAFGEFAGDELHHAGYVMQLG